LINLFNSSINAIRYKPVPKSSTRYEEHQKIVDTIDSDFFHTAKEAVIEKWMTYCKNKHIDNIMDWRLRLMACRFTNKENLKYKIRKGMTIERVKV
jgi:hypothetical protein